MRHAPIDKINVLPDRQRKVFEPEAIVELSNSIQSHGLLQPIVVREQDGELYLVAGERRLRAIKELSFLDTEITCNNERVPAGYVPYLLLGELDELAAEEAELEENLRRVNLSWQEEAAALARLHTLRQKQAAAIGKKHDLRETGKEAFPDYNPEAASTKISQSIAITRAVAADPEIAKAKTFNDAVKLVARRVEAERHVKLAAEVGRTFNSSIHELHHADCLEWLRTCPFNTFDCFVTDPPYGMGADNFGDAANLLVGTEHHYDDSYESWQRLMSTLPKLMYDAAKEQAHAYVFCDFDRFHELKSCMEAGGWYVFRTPLVNYKPFSGRIPLPENGPKRQYELCLYAIKGWKKVTGVFSDVIESKLEENRFHGANKPVELYQNLLKRSCRPGDVVCDPFAGSGTIFPAAHSMRVKAVGVEISERYYGLAVERLNGLDAQPEML